MNELFKEIIDDFTKKTYFGRHDASRFINLYVSNPDDLELVKVMMKNFYKNGNFKDEIDDLFYKISEKLNVTKSESENKSVIQELSDFSEFILDNSIIGIVTKLSGGYGNSADKIKELFELGDRVIVTNVHIHSSITYISILGLDGTFNSIFFDFEYGGKPYDIFKDELDLEDIIHDYIRY